MNKCDLLTLAKLFASMSLEVGHVFLSSVGVLFF